MGFYRTEGIVIFENNLGDSDKILTLLTKDFGKINAAARGVKRPRNRLIGGSQLFSYCEYMIFKSKKIHNIGQCEVIESFYKIRDDLIKISYTSYLAELTMEFLPEKEKDEHIFLLFLKALYTILDTDDIELLTRVYELKILLLTGYLPNLLSCVLCGIKIKGIEKNASISAEKGGVVCVDCNRNIDNYIWINPKTYGIILDLIDIKLQNLNRLKVDKFVKLEIENVLGAFIRQNIERKLKSLDFLNSLTKRTVE